jgi:hypothetical protein
MDVVLLWRTNHLGHCEYFSMKRNVFSFQFSARKENTVTDLNGAAVLILLVALVIEFRIFPQGLKPKFQAAVLSELKLRPPRAI